MWLTVIPECCGQQRANNLVHHFPGAKSEARNDRNPLEAWNLIHDKHKISIHKDQQTVRKVKQPTAQQTYNNKTNTDKIKTFTAQHWTSFIEFKL